MLTYQQIKELKSIIDYLNYTENPRIEDIRDKAEDLELLLSVLSGIKISKLKLFKRPADENSKPSIYSYAKEEVMQLFNSSSAENIIKNYSLTQLKAMFIAVYGKNPLSKAKKEDIVNAIERMLQQIKRIEGFNELGQ